MSHFSQTAQPHEYSNTQNKQDKQNKQNKQTKPTEWSLDMANAFVQVCKYNRGRYLSLIYNQDSTLYYTLFTDNEGGSIKNLIHFIQDNKSILIHYLEQPYCEEYQSKSYYKEKKTKWEQCSPEQIIYALSTSHEHCLQLLDYTNDGFIWVTHMDYYSNIEPCASQETSVSETIEEEEKKVHTANPPVSEEWNYYSDGVIGGVDY